MVRTDTALAAAAASAAVVAGQIFRFPSPVQDAVTGEFPGAFTLDYPLGYLLSAPPSALADLLTFNSGRQHAAWAVYFAAAYWAVLGVRAYRRRRRPAALPAAAGFIAYLAALAAFAAWGALAERPMARLRSADADALVLDFHSHTRHSWDGRSSFTPEANGNWHRLTGYDAGFVTDHNTTSGAAAAVELSRAGGYRSLSGEEVSLHDSHIVLLGGKGPVHTGDYNRGLSGVQKFLQEAETRYGGATILSLPEYWKHHWGNVERLLEWGASGIEVFNAAPRSLDFPAEKRAEVVELARRRGVFICGVSDSHGWGRANLFWNIMRIPGHAGHDPARLEAEVLKTLRAERFSAVRILARVKHDPAPGAALALDPPLSVWTMLRTLPPSQACVWLAWIWLAAAILMLSTPCNPRDFPAS